MTWAMLVPRKGMEFPWIAKRAAKFIDQLGHNRVTLRCDNEPAIEALAREIAQARQEGSHIVPERPPVGEGQSCGIIERAVGLVAGQARTLKAALEHRMGARVPPEARIGQGRQQAHSEACRRRIESLLKGGSAGSARLATAEERIEARS